MMPESPHLDIAIKQIEFARNYTLSLLKDIDEQSWFTMPPGCATHIGWQVAHLAMAQYGLCLFRVRGRMREDSELMSSKFRKQFSRGSQPDPDPANNPSPSEIRQVFDCVYQQSLREMAGYSDAILSEPVEEPYAAYNTKLGALLFCSHHEMIHAGQIGLLRRLLGKAPVR